MADNLPGDPISTEIAEIEDLPATDRDIGTVAPLSDDPSQQAVDHSQQAVQHDYMAYWQSPPGQEIISDWQCHGGVQRNAQNSLVLADDFMTTIPPESSDTFEAQVSALPLNLQMRMVAELLKPYISRDQPPASKADIAIFSGTPEGQALVVEWGVKAPRMVAVVGARLSRIYGGLSGPEIESANYFLDHVSGPEYKAMMAYLARAA